MACEATEESFLCFDEDGSLILKARLPALAGALLIEALDAALERVPDQEISAEQEEECTLSFEHRRADALAAVAESYLAAADSTSSTADRYQVVVHVDAQTLHEHSAGRSRSLGAVPTPCRCPWL